MAGVWHDDIGISRISRVPRVAFLGRVEEVVIDGRVSHTVVNQNAAHPPALMRLPVLITSANCWRKR